VLALRQRRWNQGLSGPKGWIRKEVLENNQNLVIFKVAAIFKNIEMGRWVFYTISIWERRNVKQVKQSRYRPGVAQRVPGS
jgi:hypothetical protein